MTPCHEPSNSYLCSRCSLRIANLLESDGKFENGGEVLFTKLWQALAEVIIEEVLGAML
jgi:hypothetical protein